MTTRRALAAAFVLTASSCGDGIGPGSSAFSPPAPGPLSTVSFRICSTFDISDVAILIGGAQWTPITANTDRVYTADVTPQVAITYSYLSSENLRVLRVTRFIYLTADELRMMDCASAVGRQHVDFYGVPQITGKYLYTHAANASSHVVSIGAGAANSFMTQPARIGPVPQGPIDVIATATIPGSSGLRAIVRRGEVPSDGDTLPVLDFTGPESVALESWPLSVAGSPDCSRAFRSTTTDHRYWTTDIPAPGSTFAFPDAILAAGDYHVLTCSTATGTVLHFFHSGRPISISEPTIAAPIVDSVGSDVARVSVPVGSTFPSVLGVAFHYQADPDRPPQGAIDVEVLVTHDYLGSTPSSILISLPDVITIRPRCCLSLYGYAIQGRPALFFGSTPQDGESVWYFGRRGFNLPW